MQGYGQRQSTARWFRSSPDEGVLAMTPSTKRPFTVTTRGPHPRMQTMMHIAGMTSAAPRGRAAQGDGFSGIILQREPLPPPRQWQEPDCLLAPTPHPGTLQLSYPVLCVLPLLFCCGRSCLGTNTTEQTFPQQQEEHSRPTPTSPSHAVSAPVR